MYTTPTVVGNLVYAGSCAGLFVAFDKETGAVRWSYDITQDAEQSNFHGNPLVTDDLIITGTDGTGLGHIYAFEQATGKVRWMFPGERGFTTDLIRRGPVLYAVSLYDEVDCIDIASGQLLWYDANPPQTDRPFSSSPAIAGDRVFFGARNGTVKALSPDSGTVLWSRDVRSLVSTAILTGADDLYLGTADGDVFRLDQNTGDVLDSLSLGKAPDTDDGIEQFGTIGNMVLADSTVILLRNGSTELVGIDRSLNGVRWRLPSESHWSSYRPHLWKGSILVGDEDGTLCAVDPATGSIRWTGHFEGTIRGIGSDGDLLLIGTLQGMLYAWRWSEK